MKKLREILIAVGAALLGVAAMVASVLWYRDRKQNSAAMAKSLADSQLEQAEKASKEAIEQAHEAADAGWAADQAETLKKVKNEASSIPTDELFDRLRSK